VEAREVEKHKEDGRMDLAKKEQYKLNLLSKFLPTFISETEIHTLVKQILAARSIHTHHQITEHWNTIVTDFYCAEGGTRLVPEPLLGRTARDIINAVE